MASGYYKPAEHGRLKDLREGLKKRLYRTVYCKSCQRELGLVNKAFYAVSVYCTHCVEYVRSGRSGH